MANPNIVNVTTIQGKTAGTVATGSAAALISNSAASNKIYKINALYVANTSTTTAYDITVDVFKNNATAFRIANALTVPVGSSIVIIGKDTSLYLEENDSLRVFASTAGFLNVVGSWEEIE